MHFLTDLRLRNHGIVSIAQRRIFQTEFCLSIALFEELLDASGRPLMMDVPSLGWMRDVARVKQQAKDFRLVEAKKGGIAFQREFLKKNRVKCSQFGSSAFKLIFKALIFKYSVYTYNYFFFQNLLRQAGRFKQLLANIRLIIYIILKEVLDFRYDNERNFHYDNERNFHYDNERNFHQIYFVTQVII